MIDDNLEQRESLINSIRETSRLNELSLGGRDRTGGRIEENLYSQETTGGSGTFFFRCACCVLLFCGFFWMNQSKEKVFDLSAKDVIQAVSENTNAESIAASVQKLITDSEKE